MTDINAGTRPGKRFERELRLLREILSDQAVSLFLILILMWLVLSQLSPYFFTLNNILQITLQAAVVALIAAGQTFVILSGGIDLSVGSVFAFSAMMAGIAIESGLGLATGMLAGLAAGTLLGVANGVGVASLHLPPFIVTLGMMSIARGMALLANNGTPIFIFEEGFGFLGQGRIGDLVPVPTIVVLIVYAICWFVLRYTPFGRFTYALGSNSEASRLSGVRNGRIIIGLYAISGLLTAVASLIEASRLTSAQPAGGSGIELLAIGAVVIGGTSLFGGEGNILGTLVGALIIATIRNGLTILGISAFWQNIATGAIIILAVWIDQLRRGRQ
ncbi:MAG: ABC transporter permease [Chloroflexota bacterium]